MLMPPTDVGALRASNLASEGYKYTEDLLRLDRERPSHYCSDLPESCLAVATPIILPEWEKGSYGFLTPA